MARRRRTRTRTRTITRSVRRAKSGVGGIFKRGIVRNVVMGTGAAVVTGLVVDRFAPQFSTPAKVGAGFVAGGPVGGIAALLLSGGLGFLGLGGGSKSGGLSV